MNEKHVLDKLSAYLDGEVDDSEAIERHLQSCPSCARRLMELRKISVHMQVIEPEPVSDSFKVSVMAALVDEAPKPARPWLRLVPALAAAVVILLVWSRMPGPVQPANQPEPAPPSNLTTAWTGQNLKALEAELALRLQTAEADEALDEFSDYESDVDDDVYEILAEAEWLDVLTEDVDAEADWDTDLDHMIDSLSSEETEVLTALFIEYVEELS